MSGRLVLLTATATLALASGGSVLAAAPTGLKGTVTRAPTRPVCIEGRPCAEPAAGVVIAFRRNGVVAARVRTGAAGAYRVLLRRGTYAVFVPGARTPTQVVPRVVRVLPGRMLRVDLEIDTGLQ